MTHYIDMTPTWSEILPVLLMLLTQSETEEGRKTAHDELKRMAALADERVAQVKP